MLEIVLMLIAAGIICACLLRGELTGLRKFLNIQALMCVALMSILHNVGTTIRSLTGLETYPQVSN